MLCGLMGSSVLSAAQLCAGCANLPGWLWCALVPQGVHFGVFGLGNKQYEHFNAVGKRMCKNMEVLGATAVCGRGDGDDDDNIGGYGM